MTYFYRAEDEELQATVSEAITRVIKNNFGSFTLAQDGDFRHGAREWVLQQREGPGRAWLIAFSVIPSDAEVAPWEVRVRHYEPDHPYSKPLMTLSGERLKDEDVEDIVQQAVDWAARAQKGFGHR